MVLQFGDSHTAADMQTGAARRALQTRFGDGGRGFISIGAPYKGFHQDSIKPRTTLQFEAERFRLKSGKTVGDGQYGLTGIAIGASKRGAVASTDVTSPTSAIDVSYLKQPRGGAFEFYVDGRMLGLVKTAAKEREPASTLYAVPEGPHEIEVRARGDGEVRIFGAALDRTQVGITYDALGIIGARAQGLLMQDEAQMSILLRKRAPQLLVFAYGTNEAVSDQPMDAYAKGLADVLGRFARAVPDAACLLLGPPDMSLEVAKGEWGPAPRLREIIETQRAIAKAARCGFFDQQAAMGGEGAMLKWAAEERANKDHVHYTRDSYVAFGNMFSDALIRAYDTYRRSLPKPEGQ
jgi:lysophospholipase L1-like esterase